MDAINYPYPNISLIMLVKGIPGSSASKFGACRKTGDKLVVGQQNFL